MACHHMMPAAAQRVLCTSRSRLLGPMPHALPPIEALSMSNAHRAEGLWSPCPLGPWGAMKAACLAACSRWQGARHSGGLASTPGLSGVQASAQRPPSSAVLSAAIRRPRRPSMTPLRCRSFAGEKPLREHIQSAMAQMRSFEGQQYIPLAAVRRCASCLDGGALCRCALFAAL